MRFKDSASLSFSSFCTFSENRFDNLTSKSASNFFKNNDSFTWGPSMLIYGPFRKLLNLGGLECLDLDNFLRLNSSNELYMRLRQLIEKSDKTEEELLILGRTLFLLGFNGEASVFFKDLTESSSKKVEMMSKSHYDLYLRSLDPDNWVPIYHNKDFKFESCDDFVIDFYSLHTHLIWLLVNSSVDEIEIQEHFNFIFKFIEEKTSSTSIFDSKMAEIRTSRYLASFAMKKGDIRSLCEIIDHSIEVADGLFNSSISRYEKFLIHEIKRRNFDFASLSCLKNGDIDSVMYASLAVDEDPYCPRAQMIKGECLYQNSKPNDAKESFYQAEILGVLERPYSKMRKQFISEDYFHEEYNGYQLVESDFYFSAPYKREVFKKMKIRSVEGLGDKHMVQADFSFPVYTDQYSVFFNEFKDVKDLELAWRYIKKSENYLRYRTFFEFEKPLIESPDIAFAPWYAYRCWKNKVEPYYDSIVLQRMPMPDFRENLIFSCIGNKKLAQEVIDEFLKIDVLQNSSTYKEVYDAYLNREELDGLGKSSLARCIGNLGFIEEALLVSPFPEPDKEWSVGDHYQANTYLFYRLINSLGEENDLDDLFSTAFDKSPISEKTLRSRFSICMIAVVYYGQRFKLEKVEFWREASQKIMDQINKSDKFNEFNKNLLNSRFYRAVSYYYWLLGDNKKLLEEAVLCERFARAVKPVNDIEELLNRDNMYSMLDSMQRIYAFVGDNEMALKMLEEVNLGIDKHDTKFWLSQGDFHLKNDDDRNALECFIKCGRYKAPLGRIGWYKAGEIFENYQEYDLAYNCYQNSINVHPLGVSPIEGISRIAKKTGNSYLESWANSLLETYKEA